MHLILESPDCFFSLSDVDCTCTVLVDRNAFDQASQWLTDNCDYHVEPGNYVMIQVDDQLGFDETGIVKQFCSPISEAGVPLLYLSTYSTDIVFVHELHLEKTIEALQPHFAFGTDGTLAHVKLKQTVLNESTDVLPPSSSESVDAAAPPAAEMQLRRLRYLLTLARLKQERSLAQNLAILVKLLFFSESTKGDSDRFLSVTRNVNGGEVSFILNRTDLKTAGLQSIVEHTAPEWVPLLTASSASGASETGVLVKTVMPLADSNVSVFKLTTLQSDYNLIKADDLGTARKALQSLQYVEEN